MSPASCSLKAQRGLSFRSPVLLSVGLIGRIKVIGLERSRT
jgi:hypothetical protein